MITYYLIGNWMGSFRTESTTETIEEFKNWADKYEFSLNANKIFTEKNGGRVVIENLSDDGKKKLGYPKIGL